MSQGWGATQMPLAITGQLGDQFAQRQALGLQEAAAPGFARGADRL